MVGEPKLYTDPVDGIKLCDIGYQAATLGLSVKYIQETMGFDKPTFTCLAIGPDYSSKIDPVTKHLKLL